MMRAQTELPAGYAELCRIDPRGERKSAVIVFLGSLAIAALMVAGAMPFVPLSTLFDMAGGLPFYILRFLLIIVGGIAYLFLHEAVHALFLHGISHAPVYWGYTGLHVYAGSLAYFPLPLYLIVVLSPVLLIGVGLAVGACFVPTAFFWVLYAIQIVNVAGAFCDLYVAPVFARLPRRILVRDTGVVISVYGPSAAQDGAEEPAPQKEGDGHTTPPEEEDDAKAAPPAAEREENTPEGDDPAA